MTDTRNSPPANRFAALHVRAGGTEGTHLAHWPPPHRGQEAKPVFMKHQQGEPAKRATPRGWRLTRAIFSEFAEDE